MNDSCFNCNEKGTSMHGYFVCDSCKKKTLRLFTKKTVEEHILKFTKSAYLKDMERRLFNLEKEFIKKRMKLLDALDKANE